MPQGRIYENIVEVRNVYVIRAWLHKEQDGQSSQDAQLEFAHFCDRNAPAFVELNDDHKVADFIANKFPNVNAVEVRRNSTGSQGFGSLAYNDWP